MRAYRKRPWSALVVDMTPLIDVIFLIIIFFIILINFSQIHIRNVLLPQADEAQDSDNSNRQHIVLTIRSREAMFLDREPVTLATLPAAIRERGDSAGDLTALIRADEAVPYEVIRGAMLQFAATGVDQLEFATWQGVPAPLRELLPVSE